LKGDKKMATNYMVLPGGWAGGWQNRQVARLLEQAGCAVVAPAFADLDRADGKASPIELLHIRTGEILNLIVREDLRDLVLVSFDMSGEVASELARLAPKRVAHLVFVDVLLAPKFTVTMARPLSPEEPGASLPCTYICPTAHSAFSCWTAPAAYRARAAGWDYRELPLNGASQIATPEEVADQLLALAPIAPDRVPVEPAVAG
jgi:pimeloyl-ACP methyl ester carboxylesterase